MSDASPPNYQPPRPPVDPTGVATPPPPPPNYVPMPYPAAPRGGGALTRIATSLIVTLLIGSVVLNVYLGVIVASMYGGVNEKSYLPGDSDGRIVILPIEGLIDSSTADFVHDALRHLREKKPAAIVLRVDSGGGYVAPSDQIWQELSTYKSETGVPIIASFGSTAASGGYYVAALADQIIAEPTTITGSIGVIAQGFTVHELLDKIGVTPEVIASTESTEKDLLNPMRAWDERDRAKIRVILDSAYERFVDVVHQGRGATVSMTEEEARAVATGEVFTLREAMDRKLVDQEGYLADAITAAQKAGGIPASVKPNVTRIGPPRSFSVLNLMGAADVPDLTALDPNRVRGWAHELSAPRLMYR